MNEKFSSHADLRIGTLDIIYYINEINLANLYVFDILLSNLKSMDSKKNNFLLIVCKSTTGKIENLKFLIKNFDFYPELLQLRAFLDSYSVFYGLLLHFILIKENKHIEEEIKNERKTDKSISELYFENFLIASKIEELENNLAKIMNSNQDKIFGKFVQSFYKKLMYDKELIKWLVKKGSSTF